MEDSEFFKYHNPMMWEMMVPLAQAKCSEIILRTMQSTLGKEFNDLIQSGNYQKAQEIEIEAVNRISDEMKKVIIEAIPIAGSMHKFFKTKIGDGDYDIPIE